MKDLYNNQLKIILTNINNIFKKSIKKLQYGGKYFDQTKELLQFIDDTNKLSQQERTILQEKIDALSNILDKIDRLLVFTDDANSLVEFNNYVLNINTPFKAEKYKLKDYWNAHFFALKDMPEADTTNDIIKDSQLINESIDKLKLDKIEEKEEKDDIINTLDKINNLFKLSSSSIVVVVKHTNSINIYKEAEIIGTINFTSNNTIDNPCKIMDFNHPIIFGQTGNLNIHITSYNKALALNNTKKITDLFGGHSFENPENITQIKTSIHNIMKYFESLRYKKQYVTEKYKNINLLNISYIRLKHYIMFNIYMLNMSDIGDKEIYKYVNEEIIKHNFNELEKLLLNITKTDKELYYYHYYIIVKLKNFFEFLINNIFTLEITANKYIEISQCSGIILENFILFNYFKHFLDKYYAPYKNPETQKAIKVEPLDKKDHTSSVNWTCPICNTENKTSPCIKCKYLICLSCNNNKYNNCEVDIINNLNIKIDDLILKYKSINSTYNYPNIFFKIIEIYGNIAVTKLVVKSISVSSNYVYLFNNMDNNHWTLAQFIDGNWIYYDNKTKSKIGTNQEFIKHIKYFIEQKTLNKTPNAVYSLKKKT